MDEDQKQAVVNVIAVVKSLVTQCEGHFLEEETATLMRTTLDSAKAVLEA